MAIEKPEETKIDSLTGMPLETEPKEPEPPTPIKTDPELDPVVNPKMEVMRDLVGELVKGGAGSDITSAGVFANIGYLISYPHTNARIGSDGWIEMSAAGQPGVRVPIRIQDLLSLAQAVGALAKSGHIAERHKGAEPVPPLKK